MHFNLGLLFLNIDDTIYFHSLKDIISKKNVVLNAVRNYNCKNTCKNYNMEDIQGKNKI